MAESGRITPLRHEVVTNDLGRGLDSRNRLSPEVISLNLSQLAEFKKIAVENGAQEIRVAATEALRRAANAGDLIDRARRELDLGMRILSGEEEAQLTYQGVISGLEDSLSDILLADVGGGSTEVIRGAGGKVIQSISMKMGAVSLDRAFIRSDPASRLEISAVRHEIQKILQTTDWRPFQSASSLIICGGTASSLAAADLWLTPLSAGKNCRAPFIQPASGYLYKAIHDLKFGGPPGDPGHRKASG